MADKRKASAADPKKPTSEKKVTATTSSSTTAATTTKKAAGGATTNGNNKPVKQESKTKLEENGKITPPASSSPKAESSSQSDKNGKAKQVDKSDKSDKSDSDKSDKNDETVKSRNSNSSDNASTGVGKYVVGDQIVISKDRCGIIRYIGPVHFQQGVLYGIELTDGSIGKSDGTVDGKKYFATEPNRAIFVVEDKIRRKMNEKDHKRVGSYHNLAANANATKATKDEVEQSTEPQEVKDDKNVNGNSSPPETITHNGHNGYKSHVETKSSLKNANEVGDYTLPPVEGYENLLSFIINQKDNIRELLLDMYAHPSLNQTMCETWKSLKQMNENEQKQAWPALLSRWKNHI